LRDELSSLQKEYATSQAALIKLESQIETKEKSIDKLNKVRKWHIFVHFSVIGL